MDVCSISRRPDAASPSRCDDDELTATATLASLSAVVVLGLQPPPSIYPAAGAAGAFRAPRTAPDNGLLTLRAPGSAGPCRTRPDAADPPRGLPGALPVRAPLARLAPAEGPRAAVISRQGAASAEAPRPGERGRGARKSE